MKTKSVVIELYSQRYCDGSIEYFFTTKNSSREIKSERFHSEKEAVIKMMQVLKASSCFRHDWHNLIRIEIEKQFLD